MPSPNETAINFVYTHEEQSSCLRQQFKKSTGVAWGIIIGCVALAVLLGVGYAFVA